MVGLQERTSQLDSVCRRVVECNSASRLRCAERRVALGLEESHSWLQVEQGCDLLLNRRSRPISALWDRSDRPFQFGLQSRAHCLAVTCWACRSPN